MNILQLSLLLAILLKCVIASESGVAQDVVKALEEPGFESIKQDWWEKWKNRSDLFDHVVMKSVEFITGFINQAEYAKTPTLAALFIKRSGVVDEVLKKIRYNEDNLVKLTVYRPELAAHHDKFFKVIDKIKYPEDQECAVRNGVINLFKAEKYDSVTPLINALEEREFNGRKLKNVAIQKAFQEGAGRGIKHIIEELHEHPTITPERYAEGLIESWNWDKSKISFPFLLAQADQGDLEKVKNYAQYKQGLKLCKAIDDAFPRAEPAGSRHARFLNKESVRLAKEAFTGIQGLEPLGKEDTLGGIISGYILG